MRLICLFLYFSALLPTCWLLFSFLPFYMALNFLFPDSRKPLLHLSRSDACVGPGALRLSSASYSRGYGQGYRKHDYQPWLLLNWNWKRLFLEWTSGRICTPTRYGKHLRRPWMHGHCAFSWFSGVWLIDFACCVGHACCIHYMYNHFIVRSMIKFFFATPIALSVHGTPGCIYIEPANELGPVVLAIPSQV